MLHVLHIKYSLGYDGASMQELQWAKKLKNDVTFDWLVFGNGEKSIEEEFKKIGSNIHIMKEAGGRAGKVNKYIGMYKYIKSKKYDIVHVDTEALTAWGFLACALFAGSKKRIMHSHNTFQQDISGLKKSSYVKKLNRFLMRIFATEYVACSLDAAKWLFPTSIIDKCVIMPNGIDCDKFAYNENARKILRKELNIDGTVVLGHVGRFCGQKNQRFLIDLFCELIDKNVGLRLLLLGDGEDLSKIKQYAFERGVEDKVIFTGNVTNVNNYLSAMDIFVFPSLFEGLGIVGVEAQCEGLECFVSNHVPEELNVTGKVKYLPLEDMNLWINEIKQAIEMLKNCPNNNRSECNNIVRETDYNIERSSKLLLDLYTK